MTRPVGRVSVIAGLVVLALSSCTPSINMEDPHMEYREAWTELDNLLSAAQNTIGGEWESLDSGARSCSLPLGAGAQAPLGRTGQGVPLERQESVADEIVAQWAAQDVTASVGVQTVDGTDRVTVRYPPSNVDADGMYIEVRFNEHGTGLLGQTRCASGDYDQINKEDQKNSSSTPTSISTPAS
jgi:hypothetical protein